MRVTFEGLQAEIRRVFVKCGMREDKAEICSRIHTESTYDGIYSHGVNRVARFVDYAYKGWVDVDAEPSVEKDCGAINVINGNMGIGILNALYSTDRAIELAEKYGIGMVGLKNTTHWMRGGTYGKYAAEKGYVAVMWTNTEACMPPWGAKECRIGNNPFVMACPSEEGGPVMLLDMAMSQYAYGKLQVTRLAGKKLSFPGGFDKEGNVTDDPGAVEESMRIMPTGYWKGSAMAFMLDILGSILSDGVGAADLDVEATGSCGGCSQIFIVIDPKRICDGAKMHETVRRAIAYVKGAEPAEESAGIHVPGEGLLAFHKEHDEKGIYVDDSIWEELRAL